MTDIEFEPTRRSPHTALAVVIPISLIGLALALLWISDRLITIGPLDRAAFGWIFVVPIWLAVPPVSAVLWERLPRRQGLLAATALAAVLGGIVGLSYALAAGTPPDCEFGSMWTPEATVGRAVLLGVGVGIGPAVAGLLGVANGRGRPIRAVVVAAIAGGVTSLMTLVFMGMIFMVPVCARP